MKTAEQWSDAIDNILMNYFGHGDTRPEFSSQIEQIQLDAYNNAIEDAAQVTSLWLTNNRLHPDIENEHLNEPARLAAHSVLQQASLSIIALKKTTSGEKDQHS